MAPLSSALLHSATSQHPCTTSSAAQPRKEASSLCISRQGWTRVALGVDRIERGVCMVTTLESCCLRSEFGRGTGSFLQAPGGRLLGCLYSQRMRLCASSCPSQGQGSDLPSALRTLCMRYTHTHKPTQTPTPDF